MLSDSQTAGTPVCQTVGTHISETAGTPISQTVGTPISETAGTPVSQTAGTPISETGSVVYFTGGLQLFVGKDGTAVLGSTARSSTSPSVSYAPSTSETASSS